MRVTCTKARHMPVMIQIRNVPEALHRKLKARAALAGKPLSQYLLEELRSAAEVPSREDVLDRIANRPAMKGLTSSASTIRRERER